ncbi:MAG: hypothetical protein AMK72_11890 [Planctomycetes bacterium SM23_25]|nr:MAG: hypothetical protein AMK72_11890 [Planctomycetes bacterium SM23_25]
MSGLRAHEPAERGSRERVLRLRDRGCPGGVPGPASHRARPRPGGRPAAALVAPAGDRRGVRRLSDGRCGPRPGRGGTVRPGDGDPGRLRLRLRRVVRRSPRARGPAAEDQSRGLPRGPGHRPAAVEPARVVLLPETSDALKREIAYYRRTGRVIPSARRWNHPYRPEPPDSREQTLSCTDPGV